MVRVLVDLPGDRGLRRGLRANDSIVVDVGTFLHESCRHDKRYAPSAHARGPLCGFGAPYLGGSSDAALTAPCACARG